MKTVKWIDNGWQRQSLLRDNDLDSDAPDGIPQGPPDINTLDWDAIKRDLHNELMARGLFDWNDVERLQNALGTVATAVLRPYLLSLFGQTRRRKS